MKIILFGAGKEGLKALQEIGKESVYCFVDNYKMGSLEGVPIKNMEWLIDKRPDVPIFISSHIHGNEIARQLQENGFKDCQLYSGGILERPSAEQWGELYNEEILDNVIAKLESGNLTSQTQEMLRLTVPNEKVLEIGCGSGETSFALAKNGRDVTAIDYAHSTIEKINRISKETDYKIKTFCIDAMEELPFEDGEFDVIFQAGLLEHFYQKQRIKMLKNWKRCCKKMISIIPNAHSLAYRVGKSIQEDNHTWPWGLELPQGTLIDEFTEVGFQNIREYTIGNRHALSFLPKEHYLRVALEQLLKEPFITEDWGQGYLLVTVGINPDIKDA